MQIAEAKLRLQCLAVPCYERLLYRVAKRRCCTWRDGVQLPDEVLLHSYKPVGRNVAETKERYARKASLRLDRA